VSGPPVISVPPERPVRAIVSPDSRNSWTFFTRVLTSAASAGDTTRLGRRLKMLVSRENRSRSSGASDASPRIDEAMDSRKDIADSIAARIVRAVCRAAAKETYYAVQAVVGQAREPYCSL
jgi:hypothetical protein